jgi:hypothetical protein
MSLGEDWVRGWRDHETFNRGTPKDRSRCSHLFKRILGMISMEHALSPYVRFSRERLGGLRLQAGACRVLY